MTTLHSSNNNNNNDVVITCFDSSYSLQVVCNIVKQGKHEDEQ